MSDLVKQSDHLAFSIDGEKPPNPLKMVPKHLRPALSFFWMCFAKLLPSITPIAALLMTWRHSGEIDDEQITDILRGLTRPELVADFKFPSDLQCRLASMVSEQIKRNKTRREMLARRKAIDVGAVDKEFSIAEAMKKVISEIGKIP